MSSFRIRLLIPLLAVALAACGGAELAPAAQPTVAPIPLTEDLTSIDLCQAIPQSIVEAALGRELISKPQRFEYYSAAGSSGCQYDAGRNSRGDALFAYVALTPPRVYGEQPLYKNQTINGIGDAAYFNNGADARQLWVKLGDKAALVVAIGDVPDENGLQTIAQPVVNAIQK